jgi:hypothetical protein
LSSLQTKRQNIPTLSQVAKQSRFACICDLNEPVKDAPVNQLIQELRTSLKKLAQNRLLLVLLPLVIRIFSMKMI